MQLPSSHPFFTAVMLLLGKRVETETGVVGMSLLKMTEFGTMWYDNISVKRSGLKMI
jgi:hypothetical protein